MAKTKICDECGTKLIGAGHYCVRPKPADITIKDFYIPNK